MCIKKYSHEFYKYIEYYIDICSVNFNGSFIKLSMWKENKKWIFFTSSTKKSRAQEAQYEFFKYAKYLCSMIDIKWDMTREKLSWNAPRNSRRPSVQLGDWHTWSLFDWKFITVGPLLFSWEIKGKRIIKWAVVGFKSESDEIISSNHSSKSHGKIAQIHHVAGWQSEITRWKHSLKSNSTNPTFLA